MKYQIRTVLIYMIISLFLLIYPKEAQAAWYYPMDHYFVRQTVKGFGQNIDDNFYNGKEKLFPYNRFYGYHAAVDLEIFPEETDKKAPVYAVSSGTISYVGNLSGYGGVILERLENENATAIYGHVKIVDLTYKTGDKIEITDKPIILTYLGDQFSSETSKERKHLHFGIYKGTDLYFKGHEVTLSDLTKRWHDPDKYLEERNAVDPSEKSISATPSISTGDYSLNGSEVKSGFWDKLSGFLKKLVNLLNEP